jgi:hypothetical protein
MNYLVYRRKDGTIGIADDGLDLKMVRTGEDISDAPMDAIVLIDLISCNGDDSPIDVFKSKHRLHTTHFDKDIALAVDAAYDGKELFWVNEYYKDMGALVDHLKGDKLNITEQMSTKMYATPCDRHYFEACSYRITDEWIEEFEESFEMNGMEELEAALEKFTAANRDRWQVYPDHGKRVKIDYNWKAE